MAKRVVSSFGLSTETKVDVFRFRGIDREFVGTMSLVEWGNLKRDSGWIYRAYQVGFCS